MLYIIRDIIFILLCIIGIAELARSITLWFLKSDCDSRVIIVVPIDSQTKNAEQLLRSTVARTDFYGRGRWKKIVCLVKSDAQDETVQICHKLAQDFPIIRIEKAV